MSLLYTHTHTVYNYFFRSLSTHAEQLVFINRPRGGGGGGAAQYIYIYIYNAAVAVASGSPLSLTTSANDNFMQDFNNSSSSRRNARGRNSNK